MSKVLVSLFYRDGGNYKCTWDVELDKSVIDSLVDEDESIEDYIDSKFESDDLFEIEDLGLTTNDIPSIKEFGFNVEYDHNYVSITEIKEIK